MLSGVEVSNRVKSRRNELGLTLQELSELSGISKSSLQRYEKGDVDKMPLSKLKELAKALKVTSAYIVGIESNKLSYEYFRNINGLLSEFDYVVTYNPTNDSYILDDKVNPIDITPEELKELKDSVSTFLRFRVNEIIEKKKIQSKIET